MGQSPRPPGAESRDGTATKSPQSAAPSAEPGFRPSPQGLPSQESLAVPKAGMSPWLGSLAQREAVGKLSFSLKEAAGA